MDLLAGLSLLGPSTTNDVAKFIQPSRLPKNSKIPYKETQTITGNYYNLIRDRPKNNSNGKSLGLVSSGYIKKTDTKINKKEKKVQLYFLTQKGHFFSIGFNFKKKNLESFLNNASKNNLFFAYIYSIYKNTSEEFVNKIFIEPINNIIKNKKLDLDNEFNFYFVNIAQAIGQSVYEDLDQILKKHIVSKKLQKRIKSFKILIDNTFYVDTYSFEWEESIIAHYYPNDSEEDFYRKYHDESDSQLLYTIFNSVYSAHHNTLGFGIPKPKNKLPLPKWLKEHRRYKNKAKKANRISNPFY